MEALYTTLNRKRPRESKNRDKSGSAYLDELAEGHQASAPLACQIPFWEDALISRDRCGVHSPDILSSSRHSATESRV